MPRSADTELQCDLSRPACSQCTRAGRRCAGYRDPRTIRVRLENDRVAARCLDSHREQQQQEQQRQQRSCIGISSSNLAAAAAAAAATPSLTVRNLAQSNETVALNFFFWHHADGGLMRYLRSMLVYQPPSSSSSSSSSSSTLYKAVAAASLECLSHQHRLPGLNHARDSRAPALRREARLRYGQALREVNDVLRRGEPAEVDVGVVAAITVLAFFMAASSSPPPLATTTTVATAAATGPGNGTGLLESPDRWVVHVDGALAVIAAQPRGTYGAVSGGNGQGGNEDDAARIRRRGTGYLLHHILGMKHIDCLQRGTRVPAWFRTLYDALLPAEEAEAGGPGGGGGGYQREFWGALHELADLRAAVKEEEEKEEEEEEEEEWNCDDGVHDQGGFDVLGSAGALDARLARLKEQLPGVYREQRKKQQQNEGFTPPDRTEAMHTELEFARAHSTLRMMQLSAAETACRHLEKKQHRRSDRASSSSLLLREKTRLIESVSEEIVHAAEKWCDAATSGQQQQQQQQATADSSWSSPRGSWACSLIWPLASVGRCGFAPAGLRERAGSCLGGLAVAARAPEALAARERIRAGSGEEGWASALFLS
ncbi:hypothetical protein N3K66_007868 [Trichothecium roseum]|uniref:Uncharacterized protein n=1 Tax=Trichothecium roseum TaxID=47278 RepID=A0ACC0URU9_9HYPO|nr:hypothetical protein N3K66_007868 [Trichothecium roseum]